MNIKNIYANAIRLYASRFNSLALWLVLFLAVVFARIPLQMAFAWLFEKIGFSAPWQANVALGILAFAPVYCWLNLVLFRITGTNESGKMAHWKFELPEIFWFFTTTLYSLYPFGIAFLFVLVSGMVLPGHSGLGPIVSAVVYFIASLVAAKWSFALCAFVERGMSDREAMDFSEALIEKNGDPIFLNLVRVFLLYVLLQLIFRLVPAVGWILEIALLPLAIIFVWQLYYYYGGAKKGKATSATKATKASRPKSKRKAK